MKVLSPVILSLALLTLAAPANPASFDCAQAGAEVEHMISNNADLSALDGLLGDRYVRALKKGEDPKALKATQRAWLRDTRNACADAACLKGAYEARIAELTKIGWMTDEKARAICEEVVEAVNDGTLWEKFSQMEHLTEQERKQWSYIDSRYGHALDRVLRFDYDLDGNDETLAKFQTGGTCYSDQIEDLALGTKETPARIGTAGYKTEFAIVGGEPLLLTANKRLEPRVNLVSWLAPNGQEIGLCRLGSASAMRVKTVKADDVALCQAVIDSNVTFAEWSPAPDQLSTDDLWQLGVLPSSSMVKTVLDIDLDGQSDTILRLGYDSSAGCGSYFEELRQWDTASHAAKNSSSGNFLMSGGWRGRMSRFEKPEKWFSPNFFKFEGKPYMLGKENLSGFTEVISFWNGDIRPWCEFELLPRHRVVKFYPAIESSAQ